MDPSKFPEVFATLKPEHGNGEQLQANLKRLAALRSDGDYPIVWAKKYGKGRVWYSTFGHLEATLDDARIRKRTLERSSGLCFTDADITPRPFPAANH